MDYYIIDDGYVFHKVWSSSIYLAPMVHANTQVLVIKQDLLEIDLKNKKIMAQEISHIYYKLTII